MKRFLPYLALALLLTGCRFSERAGEDPFARLDDYFRRQLPPDEPGGAVLISKKGLVLFSRGYGLADLETREPITPRSLFNLGSITKTFVANAVLLLQEQGRLSVEDSLIKYFPDFKNPEIGRRVRIEHLLTHTSGLPDNRKVDRDTAFYLTAGDAENWAPELLLDTLGFAPGSRFEYSNPAYNGLALIVEKVSGMKWQDFVIQYIMRPAGMETSTITDGPHPEGGVVHGYTRSYGKFVEDDYGEEPTFAASGNGGVWSSVEELAKYEEALQKAVFLQDETIRDSRTVKTFPNWSDSNPPFVGWSWFIETTPNGLTTVGHTGTQGGFYCNYVTVPEKGIFFVFLCNAPRDRPAFTRTIMEFLQEEQWLEKL